MGSVHHVNILGSLALVDGGETDHKVVVIRSNDPLFDEVDSVDDLEEKRPGVKAGIIDWMKNYKTAEGKGVNKLFSEEFSSAKDAQAIVQETAEHYEELVKGKVENKDGFYLGK